MTNLDRVAAAKAHLLKTSKSGKTWDAQGQPHNGEWWAAWQELDQIVDVPVTPGPVGPAPPVGPFTVLDGHGTVTSFSQAFVRTAAAVTIKQLQVQNVAGYGIGSMQYQPPTVDPTGLSTILDCVSLDVKGSPPGKMGGTGEANFWFANSTYAARGYAKGTGWMLMFTGNKFRGDVNDFLLEDGPVGIYHENISQYATFRRIETRNIHDQYVAGGAEPGGVLRARSITVEQGGSHHLSYEDCRLYCPVPTLPVPSGFQHVHAGYFAGLGTQDIAYTNVTFYGPGDATILPTGCRATFTNCAFDQAGRDVVRY